MKCRDISCGQCVQCMYQLHEPNRICIKHQLHLKCMNGIFEQYVDIPRSWYHFSKSTEVVKSFTYWMSTEYPIPHDEYFHVFTPPGDVKMSFYINKDTGEKMIGLTQNPHTCAALRFDFPAVCFKRLIETDLCHMWVPYLIILSCILLYMYLNVFLSVNIYIYYMCTNITLF